MINKQRLYHHRQQPVVLSRLSKKSSRDLFAPLKEVELLAIHGNMHSQASPASFIGYSLMGYLNLDSELDLDMELNLNEPPFPSIAIFVPVATSSRSVLSTSAPTAEHKARNSSLQFFFLQKGHVQRVRFARTVDEAEICVRWEAACGELTREWKCRHWEPAEMWWGGWVNASTHGRWLSRGLCDIMFASLCCCTFQKCTIRPLFSVYMHLG